jgi:hypothetical protein
MNGGGHWAIWRRKHLTAMLGNTKLGPEQSLRSACSQANDYAGKDCCDLLLQPWAAGRNFQRIGLLMQPDFTPRFPFEMLNRIGHVHFVPIHARGLQALIQQLAGRPDKRSPLMVFAITGLFAHQKYRGASIPFAKDDLRRMLV